VGDCGMLGQPMLPVLLSVSSVLLVLQAAMERVTVLEVQIDWITISSSTEKQSLLIDKQSKKNAWIKSRVWLVQPYARLACDSIIYRDLDFLTHFFLGHHHQHINSNNSTTTAPIDPISYIIKVHNGINS
jgi:hypothetical protein